MKMKSKLFLKRTDHTKWDLPIDEERAILILALFMWMPSLEKDLKRFCLESGMTTKQFKHLRTRLADLVLCFQEECLLRYNVNLDDSLEYETFWKEHTNLLEYCIARLEEKLAERGLGKFMGKDDED